MCHWHEYNEYISEYKILIQIKLYCVIASIGFECDIFWFFVHFTDTVIRENINSKDLYSVMWKA